MSPALERIVAAVPMATEGVAAMVVVVTVVARVAGRVVAGSEDIRRPGADSPVTNRGSVTDLVKRGVP